MQPAVRRAAQRGVHAVDQGHRIEEKAYVEFGALGLVAFQQRSGGFEQRGGRRILAHEQVA